MDPTQFYQSFLAGSVVMLLLSLLFSAACFGLFLAALIHCLKYKHDKDRLTWVIVIIFVPVIGGILYFSIGKSQMPGDPPMSSPLRGPAPPPFVDSMHDEKKRAAAITESLSAMSAARRKGK